MAGGKGRAKAQAAVVDVVPPAAKPSVPNPGGDAVKNPAVTAFRGTSRPGLNGGSPGGGSSGGSPGSGAATPSPGRIANAASRLQAQLSQFTEGLARQDAMLLAGTEEIGRSTERQSKSAYDFTGSMLGMVRDSHANVSAAKTRVQAQRKAYHDLNAERDSLRVEKESLTSTVEETRTRLRDKDAELEVVNEARKVLEKEVDAKAHRLATVEKQVNALNDQNKDLGAQIATKEREVAQAEVRRTELAAKHKELEKKLIASQNARDEAEAHAAKLEEANAALEEEIAAGEEAVLALQRQTEESFSALQTDREALMSRNESLQKQMAESQTSPRRGSGGSRGDHRGGARADGGARDGVRGDAVGAGGEGGRRDAAADARGGAEQRTRGARSGGGTREETRRAPKRQISVLSDCEKSRTIRVYTPYSS